MARVFQDPVHPPVLVGERYLDFVRYEHYLDAAERAVPQWSVPAAGHDHRPRGRGRTANLLNINCATGYISTYQCSANNVASGGTFLNPTAVHTPRFVRVNATFNF